jgi:hypothetical protein
MRNDKHTLRHAILIGVMTAFMLSATTAQERSTQKLAQSGMKFLSVGLSARQAALADAFTAADGNSASMFYNPAGMARLGMFAEASLGQVNWIADIKHSYAALAFSPAGGNYGVFGLSFQYVDYGEIQATILANNTQGFLDIGTIKPNAYMVGLSYARALSDKFSIGGTAKYVRQDLGTGVIEATYTKDASGNAIGATWDSDNGEIKNKLDVVAFDFGVLYRTGFESLTLGMSVRNFAREVKYQKEGFQIPLTFRLGMSINALEIFEMDLEKQSLLVSVDAEHPRDFPEQLKVGLEYVFMNMIAARVGYIGPADEHSLSYGLGFQGNLAGTQFGLDYAYTPFGIFTNVQRFSLRFGF